MKNVIVFALSGGRYAIELRWVREVTKLGHVTPVPGGPDVIAGVVNFRGAIVPVLQIPAMNAPREPRAGDGAVLIEVEGARAAICVDVVNSVSTLHDAEQGPGLADPLGGDNIPLLDPPALIADVMAATQAIAKETR